MTAHSPRLWLLDIREEIAGIKSLTKDVDVGTFSASWAMKRAIEHALLIIAEAAKNLPETMKGTRRKFRGKKSMRSVTCCATNTGTSILKYCGRS